MSLEVVTLIHGDARYTELLAMVSGNAAVVTAMWSDAESRPSELDLPGTWWTSVVEDGVPVAWCAARIEGGVLKCHSNYETHGVRGRGLYKLAYRARHREVVRSEGRRAVTYLFRQPIGLHVEDGWECTGLDDAGELAGHWWWELRWEPAVARAAAAGTAAP